MHVTDLCPKWLLNGEWAANRETRMYKHKEGNSGSQRVTLTRHRRYTPEMTLFLLPVDNYHIFLFGFFFLHISRQKYKCRREVCFPRRCVSRIEADTRLALSAVGVWFKPTTSLVLNRQPRI